MYFLATDMAGGGSCQGGGKYIYRNIKDGARARFADVLADSLTALYAYSFFDRVSEREEGR